MYTCRIREKNIHKNACLSMYLLALIAFDFFMRSMTRACNVVHYGSHAWWLIVAKIREWATVYLMRITSFSKVTQYCIMCGHGNAAWFSYVHIHEYYLTRSPAKQTTYGSRSSPQLAIVQKCNVVLNAPATPARKSQVSIIWASWEHHCHPQL